MNLVDPEILHQLTANPAAGFDALFGKLHHPEKHNLRPLLIYLDKILAFMLDREAPGLRCSHIHFPELAPTCKDAILEFLVIRSFDESLEKDQGQDDYAQQRIATLTSKLARNEVPAEASGKGKKGANKVLKKWTEERERWRSEKDLLQPIAALQKTLQPDTVINLLTSDLSNFAMSLYALDIEELGKKKSLLPPEFGPPHRKAHAAIEDPRSRQSDPKNDPVRLRDPKECQYL